MHTTIYKTESQQGLLYTELKYSTITYITEPLCCTLKLAEHCK